MGDLKNPKLIFLKGFLFLAMLVLGSYTLVLKNSNWQTVALITLLVWSSARLYYFMFYGIEKYVDGKYKSAGITSSLVYLVSREAGKPEENDVISSE